MKLVLKKGTSTDLSTLVVFTSKTVSKGSKDKKTALPSAPKLSVGLEKLLATAHADAHFHGDKKESVFFRSCEADGFKNVLFVGLGDHGHLTGESFRVAAAVMLGSLKSQKVTSAGILGESVFKATRNPDEALQALAEGIELSAYEFNELKSSQRNKKDKDDKPQLKEITLFTANAPSSAAQKALTRAGILAECQNFVRWLGDSPGNFMTPTRLAEETVKAAKGTALKVTVWDKARIAKENFGGLLAVARGSAEDPRFIIMEYNGAGKSQKPICFVGKGLTFDTGGISIKPSSAMEEMKYDMCGGAAVIGTLLALAKLKAKVNVIGLVPASENMPGSKAQKPGDVYFARNGKSVEVYNTDAEGRLILGDALVYAAEHSPRAIFDAATLTGAIVVALGNTHTGVFTRDNKLMRKIQEAADSTGELVWPMPLNDFHVEDMKGLHADLCNISSGRMAGSSTAAAFLEEFVGRDIPWAHFDIAGTAWNVSSRFPYHPKKSASGIMVRTFVELALAF